MNTIESMIKMAKVLTVDLYEAGVISLSGYSNEIQLTNELFTKLFNEDECEKKVKSYPSGTFYEKVWVDKGGYKWFVLNELRGENSAEVDEEV